MSRAETDPSTMTRVRGERFDLMIAVLTVAATLVAFGVAILTPPKGGPFCTAGCVQYPYTDIAAYIPRDFLWMYPALLPAPLFVILLSGLQERAPIDRKRFGRVAVAFGAMAAAILTAVYFVQLRYVQPAVLRGELDGLAPWTQYNPHGVFIAMEEAGYTLMGIAFLFAGLAVSRENRLLRCEWCSSLGSFRSPPPSWCSRSRTGSTWSTDSRSPPSPSTGRSSSSPERCWHSRTGQAAKTRRGRLVCRNDSSAGGPHGHRTLRCVDADDVSA